MDNAQRNTKRVDILSFNLQLGQVEWIPCPCPEGLMFDAISQDPMFSEVHSFCLGGIEGAGVFFQGKVRGQEFCLHQETVTVLYRIDNFVLKRNYYVSDFRNEKEVRSGALEPTHDSFQQHNYYQSAEDIEESKILDVPTKSEQVNDDKVGRSYVPTWGDVEEEDDDQVLYPVPPVGTLSRNLRAKKHADEEPKFLKVTFLKNLATMVQRPVEYREYVQKNPEMKKKDFYLFDFVALFVSHLDILEKTQDFTVRWINERMSLLTGLIGTDWESIPMQVASNKGWSSSVKFLCQTLNGEYQISFLKVALTFAVWKIATQEKIENLKNCEDETKSFLLGDESFRIDSLRVVRLNLNALANNQGILIDQNYAETYVSPVDPFAF